MDNKYEQWSKLFDEYLNSGAAEEYFAQEKIKSEIQKGRHIKVEAYLNTLNDEQFDALMKRLVAEHTPELKKLWYSKGIQPMPTNKMLLLFDMVFMHSDTTKNYDDYPELYENYATGFSDEIVEYRGYVFQMFFGQGVAYGVLKDGKKILWGW